MVKDLFGKAGNNEARNDNIAAPHIPIASLLYFTGIPKSSKYSVLDGVLMLTHSEMSDMESFITGQAINVPVRKKFGQLLAKFNHTCHVQNQFLPLWQGGIGRFGVEDWSIVNMLVKKSANIPKQYEFGDFALHHPITPSGADNVVKWARTKKNPEPFLLTFGENVLEKYHIRELHALKYCHVAPATFAAVFHPDAQQRVRIAFPHLFENTPGGNTPSAP